MNLLTLVAITALLVVLNGSFSYATTSTAGTDDNVNVPQKILISSDLCNKSSSSHENEDSTHRELLPVGVTMATAYLFVSQATSILIFVEKLDDMGAFQGTADREVFMNAWMQCRVMKSNCGDGVEEKESEVIEAENSEEIITLELKDGKDDYGGPNAGTYYKYSQLFNNAEVWSNKDLHRIIIRYNNEWQITSWDYYPDFACKCKQMGLGFHLDIAGAEDIGDTIWDSYTLTKSSVVMSEVDPTSGDDGAACLSGSTVLYSVLLYLSGLLL